MKILFLLTQDLQSPSGLGRYFPLAKELTKLGNQISIAATHSNFSSIQKKTEINSGVFIQYVSPMHVEKIGNEKNYLPTEKLLLNSFKACWGLSKVSLASDAEIIHIGKPHPMNSIAGLLTKRDKQIYLDVDDYEIGYGHFQSEWQKKVIGFFENKIPHLVNFITVNNKFMQNKLISKGIPRDIMLYLSTGIDMDRFSQPSSERIAKLKEEHGLENYQVISYIGTIGRASHPVDFLLKSFSIVSLRNPQVKLLMVGGGEDFEYLRNITQQLGINNRVIFCGRVAPDDVVNYYHLSDISVDPVFDDEGGKARVPLKLLESLACGVPFVTSDVGDRSLLLGDPPAGILTTPGDPNSFADGIDTILNNQNLIKTLGTLAKKQVLLYTWEKLARELDEFYRDNLNQALNRSKNNH